MASKICDEVTLDDSTFSLEGVFKHPSGRINIKMTIYREDEETLKIEFVRLYGDQFKYF